MKKLLVTAIGAAAAFGACAGEISRQAIGDINDTGSITVAGLNTALGNYWSDPEDVTNTYTVSTLSSVGEIDTPISPISGKSLDIKTTFGKPLSVNIVSGGSTNIPNTGIYFDSLVKFTVCEDTPATNGYDNAKIIMWLQEAYNNNGDVTGTNLWVRAGYLTTPGNVVATNYMCTTTIDDAFADTWHRITIKAMADMTVGGGLGHIAVPGFAIFIDSTRTLISDDPKWAWADGAYPLTEAAGHYGEAALFPSMVQDTQDGSKGTLTCASFDGTGSLTDIVFSDDAPIDVAKDYKAPRAYVYDENDNPVLDESYTSLKELVDDINNQSSGIYKIKLAMGEVLSEPLAFESEADIVLDFYGCVLTNNQDYAAITNSGASLTITNSIGAGGILCTVSDTAAIHTIGQTWIAGGNFWADVGVVTNESYMGEAKFISGGAFADTMSLVDYLVDGKVFAEEASAQTGLYDVVDIVYYTVGFYDDVQGKGSLIGTEASVEAGTLATAPAAPTKTGYTFVDWTPSTNTAITANTNFYPTWSANTYTITYYDGENVLDLAPASYTYGTGVTLPESAGAKTGYTFAGWYDNAGLTGDPVTAVAASETGNQTFYAKYTATEYTITYVYGSELSGLTPTSYTVEDAITLPTVVDLGVTGVSFEAWTNAEGTVVAGWSVGDKTGNQTFYAKTSAVVSPTIFDGGDGSSFDIPVAKQEEIAAVLPSGKAMSDAVSEGSSMTYAQAYALGLLNETTGAVDELDATIELKDGKVVVNLSSAPKSAYTVTLKVYEKQSLTAAWPVSPTKTYTLDDPEATTGFTPGGEEATANFYKTEVSIRNK